MERCCRRGIKCICWRVPKVNDSWIKELEEYLKNSFEFITELNNAKHPEETLYMVIGTQYGCVLYYSDYNDNSLRFAVAVGMSFMGDWVFSPVAECISYSPPEFFATPDVQ